MAAKNNASEKALRDIIIQRMLQTPKAHALKPGTEGPVNAVPNVAASSGLNLKPFSSVVFLFFRFYCSFSLSIYVR